MRLGILGGTFDPVHTGHLFIGRAAKNESALDQVLFLPDGDPPHKRPGATPGQRYQMVCLAIDGQKEFCASDMELVRPGRTYTVDTLLALKARNPEDELFYIIGSDTLFEFPTWKTACEVARLCEMLVINRPGDQEEDVIRREQRRLLAEYNLRSRLLDVRGPDVSSRMIRKRLRAGEGIDNFVPESVAAYIKQHKLYL